MQYRHVLPALVISIPLVIFACAQGTTLGPSDPGSGGNGETASSSSSGQASSSSSSSSGFGSSSSSASSSSSSSSGSSSSGSSSSSSSSSSSASSASSSSGGPPLGCLKANYTFDTCPSDFKPEGVVNDWQCGVPMGAAGPTDDHTGAGSLWGTNIVGPAAACQESTLTSPVIDLSSLAGQSSVLLRFWHWMDFRGCGGAFIFCPLICASEPNSASGGVLEVKTDPTTWTVIEPMAGYGNNGQTIDCYGSDVGCSLCAIQGKTGFGGGSIEKVWTQSIYDISAYANATFEFRFHFASGELGDPCFVNSGGWYIDDIEIGTEAACPP